MFICNSKDILLKEMNQTSIDYIGIELHLAKDILNFEDFKKTRLGLCRFYKLQS